MAKFTVYVLRSRKNGYRYVGQTDNMGRRLAEHNGGMTKSILFQIPFVIEYTEEYNSRIDAIRREKFLKSGKGREWLEKNVDKK
ncbi:MAG: GIY-YIG nuclease family protein [Candidatus Magasanikbacteria bacterium]|nr:GIY-YIG nuclease family protein [Candidatus Magasanikbacteria bacterium]